MARVIFSLVVSILILNIQVFAVVISDGNTINGVTFNEPWYEVKNVAGDATIFLIDKDGDMYLDADSIDVSSVITGPFANSLVIQDAADEIFVINATNAYFSGKVYPNDASLPVKDGDDLVIQNVAGTPVAIFDGGDNSLYLSGNATHAATDVTPSNALDFDGTDDYVDLPDFNIDYSGGITLEAWVYMHALGAAPRIIEFSNGTYNRNLILHFGPSNNDLKYSIHNGTSGSEETWTGIWPSNYLTLNEWTHVAVTHDASGNVTAYKNGGVFATNTGQALPSSVNRTNGYIANSSWTANDEFDGLIDGVRIWNDVRSQSEILTDMHATHSTMADTNNLIAYWDFNQVLGSQLVDQHTSNYHGTLQGEMNSDAWVSSYTERTLTIASAGNGTLAPTGAQTVADGQSFPIVATPSANYTFEYWAKTAGAGTVTFSDAANDTTWVTVTGGDATITAYFDYTTWGSNTTYTLNTTASGADVSGTVTDFPVLIRLTASDFTFANARGNGEDIRFATAANVPMGYEIERWDSTNAVAEMWVKVPSIAGNSTTNIKMFWGRAEPTSKSDGAAVFEPSNDFEGVWHLSEEGDAGASGFLDATSNNYDLTGTNLEATDDVNAVAGKGITLDGTNEYIEADVQTVSGYPFTMTAWVATTDISGSVMFIGDKDAANIYHTLQVDTVGTLEMVARNGAGVGIDTEDDRIRNNNQWYHITGVYVSATSRIFYVDGVQVGTDATSVAFSSAIDRIALGRWGDTSPQNYLLGTIDEARISSTNRSADWIKLAYESQKFPSALIQTSHYEQWSNNSTITMNTTSGGADVASDVNNFPVLVRLTGSNFTFANARGNGEDIRFATAAGIPMAYEIERWDSTNALAELWVNVPTVTGNSTTDIKMFWGMAGVESESDGIDVFTTSKYFAGVWHLGEEGNAGTDGFKDATINNYDLSGSNLEATDDVEGIVGKGISFDGVDEYIQRNHVPVSAYPFTFSGWVKSSNSTDGSGIVFLGDIDVTNEYCMLVVSNAGIANARARNTTAYNASSTTSIDDGNWHHLVAVFTNATTRKIYVNGVVEDTDATSVTVPSIDRVAIGRRSSSSPMNYTNGIIDEVQIANTTRGPNFIKLAYENQRVENYLMNSRVSHSVTVSNDGNGTTTPTGVQSVTQGSQQSIIATPSAGYTFNGWSRPTSPGNLTVVDSTDYSTTVSATGDGEVQANFVATSNNALDFDGTDDYVSLPDINVDFTGGITLEAWVYVHSYGSYPRIIELSNGEYNSNLALALGNNTSQLDYSIHNGTSGSDEGWAGLSQTNTIPLNEWVHVAITHDASSNVNYYKNGVLIKTQAGQPLPTSVNRSTNKIGWSAFAANDYFDGLIDGVRIWNDVRTQSEIRADIATSYTNLVDNGNLIAFWESDQVMGPVLTDATDSYEGTLQNMDDSDWVTSFTRRTLTIASGSNGSISQTGAITVANGVAFPIEGTPDAGYAFEYWDQTAGGGTATLDDDVNDTVYVTLTGGDATVTGYFDYITWANNTTYTLNTTVTHANVATTQTDFPVLIRLTASDFTFANARGNGEDIRFATAADVPMDYEIERWDSTNALAEIWVKVPSITGNNTTTIKMHWGRAEPASKSDGEAVFETSNNFAGVWHLGEDGNTTAGGYGDATSNNNDGTGVSMTAASDVAGITGIATAFDGSADYLDMGTSNTLNPGNITVEFWVKRPTGISFNDDDERIIWSSKNGSWTGDGWAIQLDEDPNTANLFNLITDGWNYVRHVEDLDDLFDVNDWEHMSVTFNSTTNAYTMYQNGVALSTSTANTPDAITATGSANYMGVWAGGGYYFDGHLDEFRISNTVRSADWVKLAYENQRSQDYLINARPTWSDSTTYTLNTTANYANVTTTQSDFPVLIRLTTSNFTFADAQGNGEDIRFKTSGGASMDYEIERWDSTNALAEIWVKVPSIAGNSTTDIKMLWGNSSVASESNSEKVFQKSNDFEGVWHLAEDGNTTANGYLDATANSYDLTGTNLDATNDAAAITGIGVDFNGSNEYVQADSQVVAAYPYTISGWGNATSIGSSRTMLMLADKSESNVNYQVRWSATGEGSQRARNTTEILNESGVLTAGEWYHYLAVYTDATTRHLYLNGAFIATSTTSVTFAAGVDRISIGRAGDSSPGYYWEGKIDEVRVESATRSADWGKLAYENQRSENYLINQRPVWLNSTTYTLNTTATYANVSGTVTDFPVLIRLTASNFTFADAQGNGEDIRFETSGGTSMPYEIERWDSTNALAEIWVKVPSIGGNTTTDIDMFWGNNTAASESDGEAVFETSNNFEGVWHLGETAATNRIDETTNNWDATTSYDGTSSKGVDSGIIGPADTLDADGEYITIGDVDIQQDFTISAWVNANSLVNWARIVGKPWTSNIDPWSIYSMSLNTGGKVEMTVTTSSTDYTATSATTLSTDTWYYVTGTYDGSTVSIYVNGTKENDNTGPSGWLEANNESTTIGANSLNTAEDWDGLFDEVRISIADRGADWIKLAYENQRTDNYLINQRPSLTITAGASGSVADAGANDIVNPMALAATPNAGYTFNGWTRPTNPGNLTILDSADRVTTVTATGSGEVQANFVIKPSNALHFTGETNVAGSYPANAPEYVDVPDLNFQATGAYTVEAWVYWDNLQDWAQVLYFRESSSANDGVAIYFPGAGTATLRFTVYDGGGSGTTLDIANYATVDTWTHVALSVAASGKMIAYRNGIKMDSSVSAVNFTGAGATQYNVIGNGFNNANDESFDGYIDELRFWTDIRTQSEIKNDMFNTYATLEASDNLLALWDFDHVMGDTLYESTGNYDGVMVDMEHSDWVTSFSTWALTVSNDGSGATVPSGAYDIIQSGSRPVTATATSLSFGFTGWTETVNAGNVSLANDENFVTDATVIGDATIQANFAATTNALLFDGTDEYITLPEFTLDVTNGFSIEFWVYWNSADTPNSNAIFDLAEGTSNDNIMFTRNAATDQAIFKVYNAASSTTLNTSANFIVEDVWTHVAITVTSGGTAIIYKNGYFDATGSVTMPADDLARDENYLAFNTFTNDKLMGYLDNFRVWDDVRSQTEIYNNRALPLDNAQANLVLSYNFNQSVGTLLRDHGPDKNHGTIVNMENGDWTSQPTNLSATIATGGNGTVLNSGGHTIYEGEHLALSATPSAGFVFQGWEATGAGTATFADASSDTTYVSATGGNVTVTAYFDYSSWGRDTTFSLNTTNTGANVLTDRIDFPVLVRLTSSNFEFANAMGSGEDVRFAGSDEKPLSYEIERWDSTNAKAELWVNVPSIAGNSTTNIKMYWNKAGKADSSNSETTFPTSYGFEGVYHLEEESNNNASGYEDATGNNYHGQGSSMPVGTADEEAMIGKGQRFDGTADYINLGTGKNFLKNQDDVTLSAWVKLDVVEENSVVGIAINSGGTTSRGTLLTRADSTVDLGARAPDGGSMLYHGSGQLAPGQWYHIGGVADINGDLIEVYINGAELLTNAASFTNAATDNTTAGNAAIGAEDDGGSGFVDGVIDELRIVGGHRSSDWMKLSYENQRTENYLMNTRSTRTLTLAAGTGGTVYNSGANTVPDNSPFVVSATPSSGYEFTNWTKTAGAGTVTWSDFEEASTAATITGGAVSLQANFNQIPRYITVTNNGNGSNSPNGVQAVVDSQNLTINASLTVDNMKFDHWSVTFGTATIADSTSFSTTVSVNGGDATVQANYSIIVGNYVLKPRHASGKCVDVSGGVGNDGDNIQIYDCNGSNAQIWAIEHETGDWHEMKTVASWRIMDRTVGGNGTNVAIWGWDASSNTNRRWKFVPAGSGTSDAWYYSVVSASDSRCLDVSSFGTANSTNIHMWDCNSATNQEFYFEKQ